MRESFVLIISLFVISVRCSNLDRDGFNIYKDHLRTRPDEPLEVVSEVGDRILYFFRAPLQMYSSQPMDPQEYRKREANIYKSHMLTKEMSPLEKRTSKAALSLMLQSKQDLDHTDEDHYCLHGK
ncbi:uncharacterized protein LOC113393002 [Vanessa tameamea]|uniref:Uncharacterized protein LOC113393002 n=1 Tax=Vanessa tameamea TaxID=334116 RepID=A0A8B8HPJ3_VANTA|nr:uncharacterized protein LOC113393002 [Vanessa tameamea]XP_047532056.1 uncharacterized protein LOC125067466 [Vanessa atalanta]